MNQSKKMSRYIFTIIVSHLFSHGFSQNSMVGDGFGGRLWYTPVSYSYGSYSGYAICGEDRQLWGWGANHYGQLGDGTTTGSATPVAALGMTNIRFFTSGYLSAAIKTDGTGWVWGTSPSGSPGPRFTSTPEQVLTDAKFADASAAHLAFVKNDGTVWSVGDNRGYFGTGTLPNTNTTTPVQMAGITNAVRVACGNSFTIVLLSDSSVKQVGPGTDIFEATIHVSSNGYLPHNIIDIKANAYCAYALSATGQVFSWGFDPSGYYGLLGNGPTHYDPRLIDFGATAQPMVAISACSDGEALYALDEGGNVYGCGWANVMGSGTNNMAFTPVLSNSNCKDIMCAETFGYVVKNDNSLWATGSSLSNYPMGVYHGSIFMNQPNVTFPDFINYWIQLDPTAPPMNLCPISVLPVKFRSFSATPWRRMTLLRWELEQQTNVAHYFLERSTNGFSFSSITKVRAENARLAYNYVDSMPEIGINYYRLRIVDIDGKNSFSEIKTAAFAQQNDIFISPNPVTDILNISLPPGHDALPGMLQVMDSKGQLVLKKHFSSMLSIHNIDVTELANGNYFLRIVIGNKFFVKAFMVARAN